MQKYDAALTQNFCIEQAHRALLENSGANPLFHLLPASRFDDDGLNSMLLKQACERQSRRTRACDPNLRSHTVILVRYCESRWPRKRSGPDAITPKGS